MKYRDFLSNNSSIVGILNNEEIMDYAVYDDKDIKKIKDNIIESNNAIIKSNQEVVLSRKEYIQSLEWADSTLGIAYGDDILLSLKETITSLKQENEELKKSLQGIGSVSSDEFNELQEKCRASENVIENLENTVSSLENRLNELAEKNKKLEETPGAGACTGTGDSKELEETKAQIAELQQEINNLRERMSALGEGNEFNH